MARFRYVPAHEIAWLARSGAREMRMLRSATLRLPVLFISFVGLTLAQNETRIRVPVRVVVVPAAVTGETGEFVRGLSASDFALFDNGRSQQLQMDYADEPVSLAVVVQTSDSVRPWLPAVRRVASTVEALIVGLTGEASLITFNDDVKTVQPMTSNVKLLDRAFASLGVSGFKAHCLDAVLVAADELKQVSPRNRRVILLVSQSGDVGSTAGLAAVLATLERENITVYSLAMPRIGKQLIGKTVSVGGAGGAFERNDTGIMGTVDLGKLVPEIARGEKTSAGEDAVSIMTAETGGLRRTFRKLGELERGLSAIGEELHTEYVLSYAPDRFDAGYHRIRVLADHPDLSVRSRPGYYVTAADAQQ